MENNDRPEPKSLLVLGNGKSLAKYPFDQYRIDTIGMSQAYRYWNRIKWWPTYYVCLDQNINQNFAKDIKRLIQTRGTNGIKKFFLSQSILKKYPKLKNNPAVYFVENLNKPQTRGFNGDSQITSGSFAVRFAIFLGYQKIYLLGIDAHYRPINIKWIKKISNQDQRLIKTINPEPDYFFVGYRMKGDYLHIPPKRRWRVRSNHLHTFQKISTNFNRGKVPKVWNSNPDSMLHQANILPYCPIPQNLIPATEEKSPPIVTKHVITKKPVVTRQQVVTKKPVVRIVQKPVKRKNKVVNKIMKNGKRTIYFNR